MSANVASFAKDQLKSIVERVERLDEEAKSLSDDKSEVYQEAKSNGFDVKVLKEIIRQRRKNPNERQEFESLVDLYKHALGMLPEDGTPVATRARPKNTVPSPKEVVRIEAERNSRSRASEGGGHEVDEQTPTPVVRMAGAGEGDALPVDPAPALSASSSDDLEIPTFLRRGHPDCMFA